MINFDPEKPINSPADYWNTNLLQWEESRYSKNSLSGRPLKARMDFFEKELKSLDRNFGILEMGCGSGILFKNISKIPFKQYTAIDVSKLAIEKFKGSLKEEQKARVQLICNSIKNLKENELQEYDVVLSAGLIDWLDEDELNKLIQLSKGKYFIHTFSERLIFSPTQILHRLYQIFKAKKNNTSLTSRYHSKCEIINTFNRMGVNQFKIVNYPFGSFGRAIYNLPNSAPRIMDHFNRVSDKYNTKQNRFPWKALKRIEMSTYKNIPCPSNGKILSVGAGSDEILLKMQHLSNAKITQIDLSSLMLKKSNVESKKIQGDFEYFDFKDEKFDLILLLGVLEFFESPLAALKKANSLLSQNGKLLLFFPQDNLLTNLYRKYHLKNNIFISLFNSKKLTKEIQQSSFKIISKKTIPFWSSTILCQKI